MSVRVVVVGGCAVDVKAMSFVPLAQWSDVPGRVRTMCGGVGRNLAKNFALLGAEVGLISAVGDDEFGRRLASDLASAGVNPSGVRVLPGQWTATWAGLLNERGDLEWGIFDGTILESLTREVIRENARAMREADVICVDATIPRVAIEAVIESAGSVPLYLNPASVGAARKVVGCYDQFATVIANSLEVEVLTDRSVDSINAAQRAARVMIERGVERVVVTMGAEGIVYADESQTCNMPAIPARIVDTTGAGDALGAAFVMSILEQRPLDEALARGLRAAAFTVSSDESVSERIKEI